MLRPGTAGLVSLLLLVRCAAFEAGSAATDGQGDAAPEAEAPPEAGARDGAFPIQDAAEDGSSCALGAAPACVTARACSVAIYPLGGTLSVAGLAFTNGELFVAGVTSRDAGDAITLDIGRVKGGITSWERRNVPAARQVAGISAGSGFVYFFSGAANDVDGYRLLRVPGTNLAADAEVVSTGFDVGTPHIVEPLTANAVLVRSKYGVVRLTKGTTSWSSRTLSTAGTWAVAAADDVGLLALDKTDGGKTSVSKLPWPSASSQDVPSPLGSLSPGAPLEQGFRGCSEATFRFSQGLFTSLGREGGTSTPCEGGSCNVRNAEYGVSSDRDALYVADYDTDIRVWPRTALGDPWVLSSARRISALVSTPEGVYASQEAPNGAPTILWFH